MKNSLLILFIAILTSCNSNSNAEDTTKTDSRSGVSGVEAAATAESVPLFTDPNFIYFTETHPEPGIGKGIYYGYYSDGSDKVLPSCLEDQKVVVSPVRGASYKLVIKSDENKYSQIKPPGGKAVQYSMALEFISVNSKKHFAKPPKLKPNFIREDCGWEYFAEMYTGVKKDVTFVWTIPIAADYDLLKKYPRELIITADEQGQTNVDEVFKVITAVRAGMASDFPNAQHFVAEKDNLIETLDMTGVTLQEYFKKFADHTAQTPLKKSQPLTYYFKTQELIRVP